METEPTRLPALRHRAPHARDGSLVWAVAGGSLRQQPLSSHTIQKPTLSTESHDPRRPLAWCLLALTLTGCAVRSPPTPPRISPDPHPTTVPDGLRYALSLRGSPYRYGGDSPATGFDCSGFVYHVYARQGIYLPRTAAGMAERLPAVAREALRPGDLVFFNSNGKPFSHVGIYLGNDAFIHAPSSRSGRVSISSLSRDYWKKRFLGIRRPRPGI